MTTDLQPELPKADATDAPSTVQGGWPGRCVAWALEQRVVVFVLLSLLVGAGVAVAPFDWGDWDIEQVSVDAIPDIGENQQIVFTEWPGRSPQDIDDQITYPLTAALMGMPGVKTIRSFSAFGFSTIYVIFDESTEFYWSRARIVEKLASLASGTLPQGVAPQLGPDATALGQVFWYTLEGRDEQGEPTGGWDLHELRSLQDFQVRYALAAANGVAEVASIGGHVREYQVDVNPDALRAYGVTLQQVYAAVRDANAEVGARSTEINGVEYLIRGVGFVRDLDALRQTVISVVDNAPVRVEDVAFVTLGPSLRRGALDRGGVEVVGGVVVARFGANPKAVIENVREAIAEIQHALPTRVLEDGTRSQVTIVPFYDRTQLIESTVGTLETAISQQMWITLLVVIVLMLHLRSSLLISSLLPIAVLITFVLMRMTNVTANVVSLAGIAIAIGTMVDIGIVLTENIARRLSEAPPGSRSLIVVRDAAAEVAGAVLTAVATTVLSFLPVIFLEGAEGKLFRPLAFTKSYALVASVVVALTVLPAVAWMVMGWRPKIPESLRPFARVLFAVTNGVAVVFVTLHLTESWAPLGAQSGTGRNLAFVVLIVGGLLGVFWLFQLAYRTLLGWVLAHKLLFAIAPIFFLVWGATSWLGFGTVFGWAPHSVHTSSAGVWAHHAFPGLGREFMPQLDEGAFLYMPSTMPHASIGETLEQLAQLDMLIESIPEVDYAVGKLGRSESALDPAPVSMIETLIAYHPEFKVDAEGNRLRFALDDEGEYLRDSEGELVEDPDGVPYRNWRDEIRTQQDIWNEIAAVAHVPGMTSAPLLQPISTRIVMLQSGIRAPMAVRLRGPDLESLATASLAVEALLRDNPLVNADAVNADRPVGKPYLEIHPKRDALARYGVSMRAVQDVIEIAIGGRTVTYTVEGRERYPVRVRYPRELRDTPERMERVLVATPEGTQIPLSELAEIRYVQGPQTIRSEDTTLVNYVMFDRAAGVSEVAAVEGVEATLRAALAEGTLEFPSGVSFSFAGSYENSLRAEARLRVLIPIVLLSVFLLLYLQFRSTLTTLIVFSGVAVALSGGFVALWAVGLDGFLDFSILGSNLRDVFQVAPVNLSVAVWVGFIALFGIATDDGVVMATYLKQRFDEGPCTSIEEVRERVADAGARRVRPCLMTTATTILALLPILTSYGTGADVMIPMAIPAVGGMAIELMTLFVVPALYALVEETRVRFHRL